MPSNFVRFFFHFYSRRIWEKRRMTCLVARFRIRSCDGSDDKLFFFVTFFLMNFRLGTCCGNPFHGSADFSPRCARFSPIQPDSARFGPIQPVNANFNVHTRPMPGTFFSAKLIMVQWLMRHGPFDITVPFFSAQSCGVKNKNGQRFTARLR